MRLAVALIFVEDSSARAKASFRTSCEKLLGLDGLIRKH